MKRSSTIISVIVAAVVILAALATGLYIKEVRQKSRPGESEAAVEPETELETKQAEITTRPAREDRQRFQTPPAEEGAQPRVNIRQRWEYMSEEEREKLRAEMLEIFNAKQREGSRRFQNFSREERDRLREGLMRTKKRWEDMSEEERQEYTARMREEPNNVRDAKE